MERIWGGRQFEERYDRKLPSPGVPFGEAWEIVDREDEQSIVGSGDFSGKSLHELWANHRTEIFGEGLPDSERFPILIKILDCADDLSIQVHPSATIAAELGGETKTEMWYIADCKPGSKLYVGLKNGADKASFEKAIADGTVAEQVHAITPEKGQSIFIESGRLHAIGAGFLIHEIQQNSDTTYRVFDWNRTDSQGNPRQLHISESLASIDFNDYEPKMDTQGRTASCGQTTLATCPFFKTTLHHLAAGETIANETPARFSLITVIDGLLESGFESGQTVLLPNFSDPLTAVRNTSVLRITIPRS